MDIGDVECIHVSLDIVNCRAVVKMVMNLRAHEGRGDFLIS